jgi:Cys-rich protein (TIGR01571 family)
MTTIQPGIPNNSEIPQICYDDNLDNDNINLNNKFVLDYTSDLDALNNSTSSIENLLPEKIRIANPVFDNKQTEHLLIDEDNILPLYSTINYKWKDGICDCFNNIYPTCVFSFITPNLYVSVLYYHVTDQQNCSCFLMYFFLISLAYLTHPYFNVTSYVLYYLSFIWIIIISYRTRNLIRTQKQIPGSKFEDLCLSIWLPPCSLAQSARTFYDYDKICDPTIKINNNV